MRRLIFLALVLAAAGCGGCEEKAAPAAMPAAATAPAPAAVPAPPAAQAPAAPATGVSIVDRAQTAGPATASPVLGDSAKKEEPFPAPAPRELTRRLGPGVRLKKMPSRLLLNSRLLKQKQGTADGQTAPATAPARQ